MDAIAEIIENPSRPGVKKLSDGAFRYRVGHYRIVYTVDDKAVTVRVVRVRHRSRVYE